MKERDVPDSASDWVLVYETLNAANLPVVLSVLDGSRVSYQTAGYVTGGMLPDPGVGEVRVFVPRALCHKARQILQKLENEGPVS